MDRFVLTVNRKQAHERAPLDEKWQAGGLLHRLFGEHSVLVAIYSPFCAENEDVIACVDFRLYPMLVWPLLSIIKESVVIRAVQGPIEESTTRTWRAIGLKF